MNTNETWNQWNEFHNDGYAAKRIKSAQSAKLTPIRIDLINGIGLFTGSHGEYETNLNKCHCGDFIRGKRPCKHMYRLAMEMELLDADFKSDDTLRVLPTPKAVKLEESISIIEGFSEDTQKELRDIIGRLIYGNQKRNNICIKKEIYLIN